MKRYKPTTPSRRNMTGVTYRGVLTTDKPHKSLTVGKAKRAGRNAFGRITVRHKGGGHKRKYRLIDFKYDKKDIPAKVETIEYDPNRSGFIALVCYNDGERRYVLVPKSVKVGDKFLVSEKAELTAGNRLPLSKIPVGTFVYNVELKPEGGAKAARSAGNYIEVVAQDGAMVHLKMPSSEVRKVSSRCWASIGEVSNEEHKLVKIGKAGRNRWLGKRPTVRGMAMNAVDHPMGGGEARGRGRRKHKKTKQGRMVDPGVRTRSPKKYSNQMIVRRRKTIRQK
ncbi:MAG: 50S ribosomal protein L2 [Candidatus Pacebacteria bacterium]|nr:50S ribosomal protein L2 [Candidatus Paceibacterota bacterium]